MKLLITADNGDVVDEVTDLQEYDFTKEAARSELINTVVMAVANGLRHEVEGILNDIHISGKELRRRRNA